MHPISHSLMSDDNLNNLMTNVDDYYQTDINATPDLSAFVDPTGLVVRQSPINSLPGLWPNDCFTNVWVVQGQEAEAIFIGNNPEGGGGNPNPNDLGSLQVQQKLASGAWFLNSSGQLCMSPVAARAALIALGSSSGNWPTLAQIDGQNAAHGGGGVVPNSQISEDIGCVGIAGAATLVLMTVPENVAAAGAVWYVRGAAAFGVMAGADDIEACYNQTSAAITDNEEDAGILGMMGSVFTAAFQTPANNFDNSLLSFQQRLAPNPANVNLGNISVESLFSSNGAPLGSLSSSGEDEYGYGGTGSLFTSHIVDAQAVRGDHSGVTGVTGGSWSFTGNAQLT